MIGTIKTMNLRALYGLTLTKVELGDFVVKLYFGENRLDIEEYWEYVDNDGKLIDRYVSLKFRKDFRLVELQGSQLSNVEKILESYVFRFSNQCSLKVSFLGCEFMDLKHYQPFVDGRARC